MEDNSDTAAAKYKATIGPPGDTWLFDSETGFDLTRSRGDDEHNLVARLTIETMTTSITVDPAKTALVIIDMQNFFLSPVLGRDPAGAGHKACQQLLSNAIPAARKAGIRIIWLNWGLTREEIDEMSPSLRRGFGFEAKQVGGGKTRVFNGSGTAEAMFAGLGEPCGQFHDNGTGQEIDAGNLLMRDQWNSALYGPLDKEWQSGRALQSRPDLWVHKNRMSGMWGPRTSSEDVLEREGIKTLFFTGVNTDQCVSGTLTDAVTKGYDCILLKDGCGTTSPQGAQENIEYNASRSWGFCSTCESFATGVSKMAASAEGQ